MPAITVSPGLQDTSATTPAISAFSELNSFIDSRTTMTWPSFDGVACRYPHLGHDAGHRRQNGAGPATTRRRPGHTRDFCLKADIAGLAGQGQPDPSIWSFSNTPRRIRSSDFDFDDIAVGANLERDLALVIDEHGARR